MTLTQSVLLTGASGSGKSTLIRGALEHYGSGMVVLAPGHDEQDSYVGLLDNPMYRFGAFDDILYQPSLGDREWNQATGHTEMVRWLRDRFIEVKSDVDAGKPPRYAVLGVDTLSAVGRLAFNQTMRKFSLTEPPPAQSPSGAAFYTYLRAVLESGVRMMRAIRGLGVHWIVASHPTEAEVTAVQQLDAVKSKIMPDLPGGFKNYLPSFFTTVLDMGIGPDKAHFARWGGDARRVTKSRLGALGTESVIRLPATPKAAWVEIATRVEAAMDKLVKGGG